MRVLGPISPKPDHPDSLALFLKMRPASRPHGVLAAPIRRRMAAVSRVKSAGLPQPGRGIGIRRLRAASAPGNLGATILVSNPLHAPVERGLIGRGIAREPRLGDGYRSDGRRRQAEGGERRTRALAQMGDSRGCGTTGDGGCGNDVPTPPADRAMVRPVFRRPGTAAQPRPRQTDGDRHRRVFNRCKRMPSVASPGLALPSTRPLSTNAAGPRPRRTQRIGDAGLGWSIDRAPPRSTPWALSPRRVASNPRLAERNTSNSRQNLTGHALQGADSHDNSPRATG